MVFYSLLKFYYEVNLIIIFDSIVLYYGYIHIHTNKHYNRKINFQNKLIHYIYSILSYYL